MAALAQEVARSTPELKAAFEQGLQEILPAIGGERKEDIFYVAAMIGGLVLARAVQDPRFSEEIRALARNDRLLRIRVIGWVGIRRYTADLRSIGDGTYLLRRDDNGDGHAGTVAQVFQVTGDRAARLRATPRGGCGRDKLHIRRERVGQLHTRG